MRNAVELPAPRDRHEFLLMRREGLGSSDASAIVGLNQYASPYTVWEEKTGKAPLDPPVDPARQEIMDWGNILEPVIRDETARRLGISITKPEGGHRHTDHDWLRANLDGWTEDNRISEFKTTHVRNSHLWDDQLPDHPVIQVHHAALVTGAERAVIAALIGGQRLVIHEIEINPNILEMLWDSEINFWDKYVKRDVPPPVDGHVATMEALTREWAHTPGGVEVSEADIHDHWQAWLDADAELKAAEKRKNDALAQITALMNGHDSILTGSRVWAAAQRGQLVESRLREDRPELFDKYTISAPKLDRAALKRDHPELFAQYQSVSIRPKK